MGYFPTQRVLTDISLPLPSPTKQSKLGPSPFTNAKKAAGG